MRTTVVRAAALFAAARLRRKASFHIAHEGLRGYGPLPRRGGLRAPLKAAECYVPPDG